MSKVSKPTEHIGDSLMDFTPEQSSYAGPLVAGVFLASIPLASRFCVSGGMVEKLVVPFFRWGVKLTGMHNAGVVPGGSREALTLALWAAGFNAVMTYCVTPGMSIAGQSMCGWGYKNKSPRSGLSNLHGTARRMVSAHSNMMETFPVFALSTALTIAVAPPLSTSDTALNAILLHVLLKTIVYPAAYIWDIDLLRSTTHGLAVGCSVSAIWQAISRL